MQWMGGYVTAMGGGRAQASGKIRGASLFVAFGLKLLGASLQLTFLSTATSHRAAGNFVIFVRGNNIPKRQLFVVELSTIPT